MKELKRATAFAPATIGNVGPGYDIFGVAVEGIGDRVIVERTNETKGVKWKNISAANDSIGALPPADEKNTAFVAAKSVLEAINAPFGVELSLIKGLPIGSGLGSSGASAAAATLATHALGSCPLTKDQLVRIAANAEASACGAAHTDNVAPALLGGFVLTQNDSFIQIETKLELWISLIKSNQSLSTAKARACIPQDIPLNEVIANNAALAKMIYALGSNQVELLKDSIDDKIAEPRRASLINNFYRIKESALNAGALGASISGAGPTLFALCESEENATKVIHAMKEIYDTMGTTSWTHLSKVNQKGAYLIEK